MSHSMSTATLLDALADKTVLGTLPAAVTGVCYDSRKVLPGECFVAVAGFKQDGRRFIPDALARGAGLVVLEGEDPLAGGAAARVLGPSARAALARLADAYWGTAAGRWPPHRAHRDHPVPRGR
jgi:UDP-N-acetylmuramoyl-L-alanyl-D-glutamate--2,6-diaminopimelate ligase